MAVLCHKMMFVHGTACFQCVNVTRSECENLQMGKCADGYRLKSDKRAKGDLICTSTHPHIFTFAQRRFAK